MGSAGCRSALLPICFLLMLSTCIAGAPPAAEQRKSLPRSAQMRKYTGAPRWRVLPELFLSRTVHIECGKRTVRRRLTFQPGSA